MSLPPDYLIVIDLEASGTDTYNVNRSEITEWPWVVYDLRSRIIVDAKQVFIAPQWSPNPNPTPDQVANLNTDVAFSPSLKDAVAKFDAYLYSSFALQNKTFCLLADGPWDLRHLLLLEAARKAVSLAPHFRTFFNLRTEFERCYPGAPAPADRQHLVDYLAIHPASSKTGGLASCHVMANIVARLQQDNHVFATPEVIPEFDWAAMSVRVPAIAVPVAAAVPVGGIVRLRGLPWTCVEQDIVDFFVGIPIVPKGIHFVKNAHGKATGEAFVQLHVMESVQHALQRHKQMMGRRYIEVFKSNPVDMSNHLGRADARRQLHQQQVMHAQAHKAAAAAAANAANAAAAAAAGTHTSRIPNAGQSVAPYLMYGALPTASPGGHSGFVPRLHGGANAAIPPTAPYHHQQQQQRGVQPKAGGRRHGNVPGSGTGQAYVLKVRNLPVHVAPDDVVRMFDGLEMLGDGVHLVPGFDGSLCSGEAFVEFTSESWAKKALALSPIEFANMAVTVMRSSIAEMTSTLYPPPHAPQQNVASFSGRARAMSVPNYPATVTPSLASAAAVVDAVTAGEQTELSAWGNGADAAAGSNSLALDDTSADPGPFLAEVVGLQDQADIEYVCSIFDVFDLRRNGVYVYTRGDGTRAACVSFQSGSGLSNAVTAFSGRKSPVSEDVKDLSVYKIIPGSSVDLSSSSPKCVLHMSNLPVHCRLADIAEYFAGLEIVDSELGGECVMGDIAWVRFVSADQASYALKMMTDIALHGRKLHLVLV